MPAEKLAIQGTVARLSKSKPKEVFDGRVYISEKGLVAGVKKNGEAAPSGYAGVKVVDVGDAFIYPGLIDLHSHLGYNALHLWVQPGEPKPFLHHDIWPNRSTYKEKVTWPAWVLAKGAPEALLVYVQVQALAGGTTAIQGWPSANRTPANQLVRNVDDQTFDDEFDGRDNVRTSTLTLDTEELQGKADDLDDGMGFIYHCSEGQRDSKVVDEFDDLSDANCLREKLIAIHCNAVGEDAYRKWKDRAELAGDDGPGAIVWSPFSNLWLYGETTDVPAARAQGITVCLGTDWGPSGTKNLLGELKVAKLWAAHAGWDLDSFDLVEMATGSPGDMLYKCWGKKAGRLVTHALADIAVIERHDDDPWENLVGAHEEHVLLVLIGGEPRYGTLDLMTAAGATRTTSVEVGEARRRVQLIDPEDEELPLDQQRSWTWQEALDRLDDVRADPVAAVDAASAPRGDGRRVPSALGPDDNPLILELDMPGAVGVRAGPPPEGFVVNIPKFPSLRHDRNWRSDVKNLDSFHGGVLDDLDDFYT